MRLWADEVINLALTAKNFEGIGDYGGNLSKKMQIFSFLSMEGPGCNSTAIFLAGDDRGGFYDHVVPPVVDMNRYGRENAALLFWVLLFS
jgi:phospholipase C